MRVVYRAAMAVEPLDDSEHPKDGSGANVPAWLARHVPIVGWLPQYQRAWLTRDAIAGATIWGLLIPEMIAYAGLAGLSPQAGLYTLLASLALWIGVRKPGEPAPAVTARA